MTAYMGGKHSIAPKISKFISEYRKPGQLYIEPFLGMGSVMLHMPNPRQGYDAHKELVALWQASLEGWIPPDSLSEEEYTVLKKEQSSIDSGGNPVTEDHIRGWAGFSMGYGGRWFEGYKRLGTKDKYREFRCFYTESLKSMKRKVGLMDGAEVGESNYKDLDPTGAIIYCDPPYIDTTGYRGTPVFDHKEFWDKVRVWSKTNTVFVSEVTAPDDFEVVWESIKYCGFSRGKTKSYRIERLFKLKQ